MNVRAGVLVLAALCAAPLAFAQDTPQPARGPDAYLPLFTPEMIQRASPEQAERMRITEERNRATWEARQRAARAQAAEIARREQAAAEPPPRPQGRNKIYRWVDKDGNVHFGDAPAGDGAKEVEVGGVARQSGNPLPPPNLTGGER